MAIKTLKQEIVIFVVLFIYVGIKQHIQTLDTIRCEETHTRTFL